MPKGKAQAGLPVRPLPGTHIAPREPQPEPPAIATATPTATAATITEEPVTATTATTKPQRKSTGPLPQR